MIKPDEPGRGFVIIHFASTDQLKRGGRPTLPDHLLNDLNPSQRQAVLHGEGPLLILAGAGSGKTRVITTRVAHLMSEGWEAERILAVTFTNKAAEEMRRRVDLITGGRGRGVWISTFHSFGARFLRIEAPAAGLDPRFLIYDTDDQTRVLRDCLKELKLDDKKHKPALFASIIDRAKDELLDAESYAIHALTHHDPFRELASRVYTLYQRKLRAAGAVDFGDLLLKTVMVLRDNTEVRGRYQARFRHVLIDEYQDTNHAQYLLCKHLTAPPRNLCVVGDDDQSIYAFRGADLRNILEFERDYPGALVVKLERNYRSTQPILTAAHNVIRRNQARKDKKLWTERAGGDPVTFHEFADENEEARFVAGEVARRARLNQGPETAAVFYRTNAQSRVLEDAFRRERIPYVLVGSVRFYERREIKDLLAYVRLALSPADNVSFKRVLNVPPRGLGASTLEALEADATEKELSLLESARQCARNPRLNSGTRARLAAFVELLDTLAQRQNELSAASLVRGALESTGLWAHWESQVATDPEAGPRLDNLQELINAALEFEESSEDKSASAFLERVSLFSAADLAKNSSGAVTLMTVHLAKGLEFPVVFLTGLEEVLFPIGESAFDPKELEEERRLCYVGMTRAKEKLFLTSAASRKIYGRSHWNVPSRFVAEAEVAGAHPPEGGVARPVVRDSDPRELVASFDPDEDAPPAARPLRVGARVRHGQFGSGKILDRSGTGEHVKLTVLFDSGARKNLLARYAALEVL